MRSIFVDGCFWLGAQARNTAKGKPRFWKNKFARNIARDRRVNRNLWVANWRGAADLGARACAEERDAVAKPDSSGAVLN